MSTEQTTVSLISSKPSAIKVDVLVIAATGTADDIRIHPAADLSAATLKSLGATLSAVGYSPSPDALVRVGKVDGVAAQSVTVVGLGAFSDAELTDGDFPAAQERLRRAAGAALRSLSGVGSVAVALPVSDRGALQAVTEGTALGAYRFTRYRSAVKKTQQGPGEVSVLATKPDGESKKAFKKGLTIAQAVNRSRDLVNTTPRDLYPEVFASVIAEQANGRKVKVTIYDEKRLEKEGFGGILGVGQGSVRPPRLVKVEYAPARAKKHFAIVGKGITFDSGGISIKPASGMENMKSDMAGAAAAVQAVFAIADLGLPVKTTAWLAIAENMPGGAAQRPSDVITMYGGKTVEVVNTDAEGRLVMADALVAASAERPDLLVDVATLTGAQMVALGTRVSGVMGSDWARSLVVTAADLSGEQFWPMPLPEELRATIDSAFADIVNSGGRFGGMLSAGVFLRDFVGSVDGSPVTDENRLPWAHLDIAGPSYNTESAWGYTPSKGTGVAVRTLVRVAEELGVTS